MPLFRRTDGELCKDLSPVRRLMPYLMRGRNEAIVYYDEPIDLTRVTPFLAAWNATHEDKLTLFHLVLCALGRVLHERPGLNRFVSGGRIYQRRGVSVSFAAKRAFDDAAPLLTIKLELSPDETLEVLCARVRAAVGDVRTGAPRPVDREVQLVTKLPSWLLRAGLALFRWLDRVNLAPKRMLEMDPMYASAFVANLGSIGLRPAWHHLYEYGTVSLFAVLGAAERRAVVGADGGLSVREEATLRFALDERINDGFYCVRSLGRLRELVESPEQLAGS
jgi:hypothetical protein